MLMISSSKAVAADDALSPRLFRPAGEPYVGRNVPHRLYHELRRIVIAAINRLVSLAAVNRQEDARQLLNISRALASDDNCIESYAA